MHGKRDRRIGDGCPCGFTDESMKQDICILLDHIHGFYEAALDRLPVERIPSLAPRLLKAGVCLGFLDPVSNIIANTISYKPSTDEEEEVVVQEEARRESILSKIITDTRDRTVFDLPLDRDSVDGMTVARRSLDGLITFLTTYFRYFAHTEALRYLRMAGADLVAAVRLIQQDRANSTDELAFNATSLSSKIALECAAVSAMHPEPAILLSTSLSMASLPVIRSMIRRPYRLSPATAKLFAKLLSHPLYLAGSRLHDRKEKQKNKKKKRKRDEPTIPGDTGSVERKPGMQVTSRYTQTLKLLLLGKIHGLYLEALARLPRDGLRKLHHCSLIKGGYCYGPMDPVSNIVLNTIWYGSMFPTHHEFEFDFPVDMIGTRSLTRIECCSLYGLVAFLRAHFSSLTEHDAVWYLLVNNADVWSAMKMAEQCGHDVCGTDIDAYKEAALASWHTDPNALVKFATSSLGIEPAELSSMLAHALNDSAVERITIYVSPKSSLTKSEEQVQLLKEVSSGSEILNDNQKMLISALQKKFKADQGFFVRKVTAALNKFSQQKGVHYELHVICGVNPKVAEGSGLALYKKNLKHEYYSHINFWATPKGSNAADTAPVLFFAECSNSDEDEERTSLCFPVLSSWIDDARCFCCESKGFKIVHPHLEIYRGRYEDFYILARGDGGFPIEFIISSYNLQVEDMCMCTTKEDWIYFDPNMDASMAQKNPVHDWVRDVREWGRII